MKAKFALLAVSLALTVVATEATARVYRDRLDATTIVEGELFEHDAMLGWQTIPGASQRHRHRDFDVTYNIDSCGRRRDAAGCPGGAETTPAIWAFGDSFTFGLGVGDHDTFASQLSRLVERPVLNLGRSGYDAGQYWLLYERTRALIRQDDLILWGVYTGNDVDDLPAVVPAGASRPKPYWQLQAGVPRLMGVPVPRSAAARHNGSDGLAVLGLVRRAVATSGVVRSIFSRVARVDEASLDAELTIFRRLTERLPRSQMLYVLIPSVSLAERPVAGSREALTYRRLCNLLAARGDLFVDMLTRLNHRSGFYFPSDGHWNRDGHALAADAIADAIAHRNDASR